MRNIKKKTPIGMIAIMALIAWVAFCGSAIADSVSGSAGTSKYFLKPGSAWKGDLAMDGENTWEIIVTGIDGSGVAGNKVYQTFVQESVAWNNFPIQVHHTHPDGTVWLLQSNEFWTVKSSHGFNKGAVTGPFDLRYVFTQNTNGTWHIEPYYRVPSSSVGIPQDGSVGTPDIWHLFYEGAWDTTNAFDFIEGLVGVQNEAGGGGILIFDPPIIHCVETNAWYVSPPNPIQPSTPIQHAINNASSGDMIIVAAGTYNENVVIDKGLTLEAASQPVIDGGLAGPCVTIAADGVTIDGFELFNGTHGVASWQTNGSTIKNCIIHNNLNLPSYAGCGILFWSDTFNFQDNEVLDNTIYNNDRQGIYIGGNWTSITEDSNLISGNMIYNNGLNTTSNLPDDSGYGIQLHYTNGNTVTDNEIYNHHMTVPWDFGQGVYLDVSYNNTLSENSLHDNAFGVVQWNEDWATPGTNYVHDNCISNNTNMGMWNLDTTIVDATSNWWGDASGPYHPTSNPGGTGDRVSDNVEFDPWLELPPVICDEDGDGVDDSHDLCPGTVADAYPSKRLGTNRWIWNGSEWETNAPRGKGVNKTFTIVDTHGCSCEQILAILEEKTGFDFEGHYKFGCASSILEDWISGMYYLETVEVPATSPGVNSQSVLMDNVDYLLKASDVADAGDTIDFDAKYSITKRIIGDTWTDTVSGYVSYGPTLLDLFVNDSSVDWGAYNSAHEYWYELAGEGAPVSFYVYDIFPINNIGSLFVDISVKLW